MTLSRSFHVAANGLISFFLVAEKYSCVCVCVPHHLYHSSVDGHLGRFHVLATVNSAAMNIGVHVSFQAVFFSGYVPRCGIVVSYGTSNFSFLSGCVLHSGPTCLHSHQQGRRAPFSPHPLLPLFFVGSLMIAVSYDIPYTWNLKRNDTNELTKQKGK